MKKWQKYGLIFLIVLGLIAFRSIGRNYFYDPLIQYFITDYLHAPLPEIDTLKFSLFLFIKYTINTLLSIAIIHLLFQNLNYTKFSVKFYSVAFVVFYVFLVLIIKTHWYNSYLLIFYVRRFLIHPLFLLILIPAFYYQKTIAVKNK